MHVITVCPKCNKDFMYHTTDYHLERGATENQRIIEEYPIQDETWASRRWNLDRTEYCDLSGCYHICQECDEKERKEATDVNFNGERLCKQKGCTNNANEYSNYCNDCYDEKYGKENETDTIK